VKGWALRFGLAAVTVAAAVGLALPVEGQLDATVQVIDSNAVAASVGVISRVPAETAGGAVLAATAITLDKAQAKAAGFTGGELAETFLLTSSDDYRNPSLVVAQYPPSGYAPAEATGGGPEGSGVANLHAVATGQPRAEAVAAGGGAGDPATLAVGQGQSFSHGELASDGAVVTRAVAVVSDVTIGAVVTLACATTDAITTVPAAGEPSASVKVTISGLLVGGVPAELTDGGLRVADQVPVGPGQLLAFNAALARLAERGITITAAPAVRKTGGDAARAEGGAVVVRYRVADQIGGDEEFVLAQARSRSTLMLASGLPELPLPVATPVADTPVPIPPPASGTPPPAPRPRVALSLPAASPVGPEPAGLPVPAAAGTAETAAGTARPTPLLLGQLEDPAVARLRSGYGVILLLAAAGGAFHLARHRTRLT
jgi:hypothetical protein